MASIGSTVAEVVAAGVVEALGTVVTVKAMHIDVVYTHTAAEAAANKVADRKAAAEVAVEAEVAHHRIMKSHTAAAMVGAGVWVASLRERRHSEARGCQTNLHKDRRPVEKTTSCRS